MANVLLVTGCLLIAGALTFVSGLAITHYVTSFNFDFEDWGGLDD